MFAANLELLAIMRAVSQQICLTDGKHNTIADGKTAAKYRWHT
jgi:hypothetical protein